MSTYRPEITGFCFVSLFENRHDKIILTFFELNLLISFHYLMTDKYVRVYSKSIGTILHAHRVAIN